MSAIDIYVCFWMNNLIMLVVLNNRWQRKIWSQFGEVVCYNVSQGRQCLGQKLACNLALLVETPLSNFNRIY